MNDKKNIDRLFQEKFKDFEVTPNNSVWKKIKARQNNGRKRAIIFPIWYRVAGVAALIAVLLSIGYVSYTQNPIIPKPVIVTTDNEETNQPNAEQFIEVTDATDSQIVDAKEKESYPITQKNNNTTTTSLEGQSNNSNATSDQKGESLVAFSQKEKQPKNDADIMTPVGSDPYTNAILEDKTTTTTSTSSDSTPSEKGDQLFKTPTNQNSEFNTTSIAENNTTDPSEKKDSTLDENKVLEDQENKKSIFDAIPEEEEAIVEETTSSKKWNIAPNIAPVYYDAIGNGSSIDSQFADNNKNGQVNLSYGIQVSYAINNKLSIRSGVNRVDLSYNTEDVGFSASVRGRNIQSIDYNSNAQAILVSDFTKPIDLGNSGINRDAINQGQNIGLLNQKINYLEVPLEMKYALVNKKLGVNMIGGMSTLFLQDNEISIEAGDFETEIGQANNLNEVSFSGNIGLGLDYKLSDQFQINLEPIFKYQFNAFEGNTEDFKPYYFGVYTGVSIKF